MNLTLHVWRQKNSKGGGKFDTYQAEGIDEHMSFLEMLDHVNEGLIEKGIDPIAFDHDCREGICGACGVVINGIPHGKEKATTTCQLHMRHFHEGEEVWIEPWRAGAFPIVKDLVVDRSAFDRIIASGGQISVHTGSAPDANEIAIPKEKSELAFDGAACIGCGACVGACPNASASLFVAAKLGHLGILPQGQPEKVNRTRTMVAQMDAEGFGSCTNHRECEAVCPKEISIEFIARMNRDFITSMAAARKPTSTRKGG